MQGTKKTSPTISVRQPQFCRECNRQLPKRGYKPYCATCIKKHRHAPDGE